MKQKILETEKQEFLFKPENNSAGETNFLLPQKGKWSQGWEYPAEHYKILKAFAHRLELNPTYSEIILKNTLLAEGINFEFQKVIPPYIADFYFPNERVIVEVDGEIHNKPLQTEKDDKRNSMLANFKIIILRFTNDEIRQDLKTVIIGIKETLRIRHNFGNGWIEQYIKEYQRKNKTYMEERFTKLFKYHLQQQIGIYFARKHYEYMPGMNWRTGRNFRNNDPLGQKGDLRHPKGEITLPGL